MTEDTSLLAAGINTHVGKQVVLLGLMVLSLGIIIGINLVAQPAAAEYFSPLVGYRDMPWWLNRAARFSKYAAGLAIASVLGLVYVDWKGEK